jgi:hypothetical protein
VGNDMEKIYIKKGEKVCIPKHISGVTAATDIKITIDKESVLIEPTKGGK